MSCPDRLIAAENTGRQTQVLSGCDGEKVQGDDGNHQGTKEVPESGGPA
jgi:hypothetical protein